MGIGPNLLSQTQMSSPPPATPSNPYQYTPGATIGPGSSYGTKTYNTSTGGNSNIYSYAGGNPNFNEQTGQYTQPPVATVTPPAAPAAPYNGPTFTPTPQPTPSQGSEMTFLTPRQIKNQIRFGTPPAPPAPAPAPAPVQLPPVQGAQLPEFDQLQQYLNSLISGQ